MKSDDKSSDLISDHKPAPFTFFLLTCLLDSKHNALVFFMLGQHNFVDGGPTFLYTVYTTDNNDVTNRSLIMLFKFEFWDNIINPTGVIYIV